MHFKIFDYIVVGAGSAGCIIASRLSIEMNARVLLLEAGQKDKRLLFRVPAAFGLISKMLHYKWNYSSEPEPYLNNRQLPLMMGRVLGGSSSVNGMVYNRGNRMDYDSWAQMGCEGWSYREVLPIFREMETHHNKQDEYHGSKGKLDITSPSFECKNVINKAFILASVEAGYSLTSDFDGVEQEGIGYFDRTITKGTRVSSSSAFLSQSYFTNNLSIKTKALVTKVILKGKKAVGVEYNQNNSKFIAYATKEIILCAGAIATPQLLMLSGIGPHQHLHDKKIEVQHILEGVGQNLQNHPDLALKFRCESGSYNASARFFGKLFAGLNWIIFRTGAAATNHFSVGAFVRSATSNKYPDLKLSVLPMLLDAKGMAMAGHGFQIHLGLVRPTSIGSVQLRSKDPLDPPEIRFNYLSDQADIDALNMGIAITRSIVSQPAFQHLCPVEVYPGRHIGSYSKTHLWIRKSLGTSHHPVGTCKMGALTDKMAVVDSSLRVIGTKGLRIADGSVIPKILAGNTNAPIMMIGAKLINIIKSESFGNSTVFNEAPQ